MREGNAIYAERGNTGAKAVEDRAKTNSRAAFLADKLIAQYHLEPEEYRQLIEERDEETTARLAAEAVRIRQEIYGNAIFIRGLIEISNICRNDCLYCGIRRSNGNCDRYRLSAREILDCAEEGYALGFRTFVMQGGEDPAFTDEVLAEIITSLKHAYPDCAVTLSLGERSRESYERLHRAGADRYLLRHETADPVHYCLLHPPEMSFENRMRCLEQLKEIGFQTGCGMMVGSPGQTTECLAEDLAFIEKFRPEMCGIGPFIPHRDTPFAGEPAGTAELTCFLLSVIRIIHPPVLLPATTALGTISPGGRERGILSGANVIMPNLSPSGVRDKYTLYNNKLSTGVESAQHLRKLDETMQAIGYRVCVDRGDIRKSH